MSKREIVPQQRSLLFIEDKVSLAALQTFVAIADFGTFRSAAVALGYTQSAVSHRVRGLEEALGETLFQRPGGRAHVTLTPAGEAAYRQARRALAAVEALGAEVRAAASAAPPRVRIGAFQSAAAELLPTALGAFREARPGVEVVLSDVGETPGLLAALARGDLDVAFVLGPVADERVEAIPLVEDPVVLLARRDTALGQRPEISLGDLEGVELVGWTRRWRFQVELEEAIRRHGVAPRFVYRTDDTLALQRLVAAGLGAACVGRLAALHTIDPLLTWRSLREQVLQRTVYLCYPRHREVSGLVHSLVMVIRDQVGRRADPTARYRTQPVRPE